MFLPLSSLHPHRSPAPRPPAPQLASRRTSTTAIPCIYIGCPSYNIRKRDIQCFFSCYDRLLEIDLKNWYGFMEFEDSRDVDDAVYELNSKERCSEPVTAAEAAVVEVIEQWENFRQKQIWTTCSYKIQAYCRKPV